MARQGKVAIAIDWPIATVRIDNPARRNAIDSAMWRALAQFAAEAAHDTKLRAVVIRGEGEQAFSAGADVSEFGSIRTGDSATAYDDLVEGTCRAIQALPQASIAVIRGACAGAGNSLVASCDLRIAADNAYFAHPAARLGLGYDPRGIARLAGVYGAQAVRQLLLFGRRLSAAQALALGAIDEVAPAGELDALAATLAQQASRNAPLTIRAAKAALRALAPMIEPDLMAELQTVASLADRSEDYAEGLAAFRDKREPKFEGR